MRLSIYIVLGFVLVISVAFISEARVWKKPKDAQIELRAAGVIRVGRQPKQIGVTPDGRKAYITNFGGQSISVLDLQSFRISKTIQSGGAPVELAFTPDSKYAYVTNFDRVTDKCPGAGLWKIDTHSDKILVHIEGRRYPKGLVVSPDGKYVYFSTWWWPQGYLYAVSVEQDRIIRRGRAWDRPRGMAISPDGKTLYLCNFGEFQKAKGDNSHREGAGLAIIDAQTFKRKQMIYAGYLTRHVVINPTGNIAYVSHLGSSNIAALDARTGRVLRSQRFATGPKTIDLTSDGRYLFVANYFGRSISVIDTKSFREEVRMPIKDRLSGLDVCPKDRYVYVTGWDTHRVWRFAIERGSSSSNKTSTAQNLSQNKEK